MPPKLGIIAGGGNLPGKVVEACRAQGREFFVIAIEGQADAGAFADAPHAVVRLGAAGRAIEHLRKAGCEELVLAGIVRRPRFATLRPDAWGLRFLAESGARSLGDGAFLEVLIRAIEEREGFRVVGIETVLPELLAARGVYGRVAPDQQAGDDIETATAAALEIGAQDIAQGAVAQLGQVLAVEDAKGTNALLKRARKLRLDGPGGVLVKVLKPDQERRVDLPTIGVTTIENAFDAGLRGIAIEAGGAIVMDRAAVVDAADKAGMFVVGIDPPRGRTAAPPGAEGEAPAPSAGPLVYVVAGEPSGDVLGARLMAALKTETNGKIAFAGVGGARMEEQGLKSLFPMSELSVMGAAEVLPRLPRLIQRIGETRDAIVRAGPAVAVTIDSPDFNFRVGKRLKGRGIPLVHYVAPSVWAWRPGRARKIAAFLDHLLALLPFEPPLFEAEGLASTFVGHPVVEGGADTGDGGAFRARHGIAADETLIAVLPGSRTGEVGRLADIMGETLFLLKKKVPELRAVVPTVDPVAGAVRQAVAGWPVPTRVVDGDREKFDAFAAADVALAASGTVTLELAMAGTPTVVTYRVNPLTALVVRRMLNLRFYTVVNLVLDREAVPELMQEACRPDFLAAALEDLLLDSDRCRAQQAAYDEALALLGRGGLAPSVRAARAVLGVMAAAERKAGA